MAIERDHSDSTRLPGFSGGLGAAQRLAPIAPRASVEVARPDRWIIATLTTLTAGFLALAVWVVTHPPAPIVIAQPTVGTGVEPAAPAEIHIAVRDATHDPSPRAHDLSANLEARDDSSSGVAVATSDDRSPRTRQRRAERVTPRIEAPPKVERGVSAECVIDPKAPGCADVHVPKGPPPPPKVADDRPLTLAQSEIRAGIAPLKPTAKACATRHGGKPGETVRVKLSIAGPTGAVISTAAEGPHQGTPLGNCVAATLKKATFATFKKPVIGLVYAVTM